MAYRAQPGRSPIRRRNGYRHHPSNAARIAIARATSRKPNGGGAGGTVGLIALFLVFVLVAVIATSVIAVGGATTATLAQLEQGLPDVHQFEDLGFAEPTVIYDRKGQVELARFQEQRRDVVTFEQIPQLVLDATTAVEDRTFWENQGYDPTAILSSIASVVSGDSERGGASTITQQFVRARLLPPELLAPDADIYIRKAKEIIQAAKLTQYVDDTYGPEVGKQRIVTAYLNQIFYGHNAYGVAAASEVFFGKPMDRLTLSQAALLAGLPKSPSTYDPYLFAVKNDQGQLVVPSCGANPPAGCVDVDPVQRRNLALRALAQGFGRWTKITAAQLDEALDEPIILAGDKPIIYKAPHFVVAMKKELDQILVDREPAELGGYKVITTLDYSAQTIAEKYVRAGTIVPQLRGNALRRAVRKDHLARDTQWIGFLRNKGIYNGSMSVLDYKTGDVLAYVGSADYYADDRTSGKFQPKFDVAGVGYRQPGSAWKPIVYGTALDERAITAGTVLLDVTTPFGRSWDPKDADLQERGPVRARKALQYSLNIPAIRVLDRVGTTAVDLTSQRAGITFPQHTSISLAGLAGAIGTVEVRELELTAAFGAFGNGGIVSTPRMILSVTDPSGNVVYKAGEPEKHRAFSPQAAWIVADILKGNTNPAVNSIWGPRFELNNGPGHSYRVAALKTGTTNELADLSAYGFLPKPNNPDQPALALGVWMGNSNHRPPTAGNQEVFASDGPAQIWHAFLRDYMNNKPTSDFQRPSKGLVQDTIDAYSGGRPGEWTKDTVREWFIDGTQPSSRDAVDKPGVLYSDECGQWMVDPVKAENPGAPESWKAADREWASRAQRGTGVRSPQFGTTTAYFWNQSSWGGPIMTSDCTLPPPSFSPLPSGEATPSGEPTRPPHPTPTPERTPRQTHRPHPTPTPDVTPKPTKKPKPTPIPTCNPDHPHQPHPCESGPPGTAGGHGGGGGIASRGSDQPTPTPGNSGNDVPANAPIPGSVSGLFQPAIPTEPFDAHPVRMGRRRRGRRRRRP